MPSLFRAFVLLLPLVIGACDSVPRSTEVPQIPPPPDVASPPADAASGDAPPRDEEVLRELGAFDDASEEP